jgi:hypothetical protein
MNQLKDITKTRSKVYLPTFFKQSTKSTKHLNRTQDTQQLVNHTAERDQISTAATPAHQN